MFDERLDDVWVVVFIVRKVEMAGWRKVIEASRRGSCDVSHFGDGSPQRMTEE